MIITWIGVDGSTYDVDKSTDDGTTWTSLEEDYALTETTDADGDLRDLYRVRTHGSAIWNPPFHGVADSTPERCTVYGYVRNPNGEPAEDVDVFVFIPKTRQYLLDAFYSSNEPYGTTTNSVGYWSIDLPISLVAQIKIPFAQVSETITVPDLTSVSLSSLI